MHIRLKTRYKKKNRWLFVNTDLLDLLGWSLCIELDPIRILYYIFLTLKQCNWLNEYIFLVLGTSLQNKMWRCVLAFSHKGLLSARGDKLECTKKAECENAYETHMKKIIFDVIIASDIIDSLYKILGISQTKQRISQTSQLILQNRKDRKRRHTNKPFKPLFIALFLTK